MIRGNGYGSLGTLGSLLHELGKKRPFIVTGRSFYSACGAEKIIAALPSEYKISLFDDFSENPAINDVARGISIYRASGSDCILAIGGGSSIDMAKLINGLANGNLPDIENDVKKNSLFPPLAELIAVPTTAGSGSEATHFAVVYCSGSKFSYADPRLLPGSVILDASLLESQPGYQMAVSGADAFSQAIESFWSVNSTEESRKWSHKALKILFRNLPRMLETRDRNLMSEVLEGAHFSGKAINISKTTAPHAISYGFTSRFRLAHGHAVALSLPFFARLHASATTDNCADPRGSQWVRGIVGEISDLLHTTPEYLPQFLIGFFTQCGLELDPLKLGISPAEFLDTAGNANTERLGNNPVRISRDEIEELCMFVYSQSHA